VEWADLNRLTLLRVRTEEFFQYRDSIVFDGRPIRHLLDFVDSECPWLELGLFTPLYLFSANRGS
jgi:hypothetical protein